MIIINNYIIDIGISDKNIKEIIFKSPLIFTNNFINYPYGITKTRYQTDDLFSYNLEVLNNEDVYTIYKLIIIKKDISRNSINSKFFLNEGWNLNLRLWYPLNRINNLSLDILYKLIPNDYGEI